MSITYDTSKVIPGEVVDRSDAPAEPRTPAVRKVGSAAAVAAKVTGRGLAGAGRRWVDGYTDGHRQMIETAKAELAAAKGDPDAEAAARRMLTQRRAEYREHRKRYLAKTGIGVGGVGIGATVGTLVIGGWAEAAMALAGITAGAIHGRKSGDDGMEPGPEAPLGPLDLEEDDGEPFPLAWCKGGDQVRVCIERAFKAEGIGARQISVQGYRGWGWEVAVELKGATPGKVMAAADQIEAHLALPDGGFMPEPDSRDKSRVTIRIVQANPFADMPRPTVHPPKSLSVHDTVVMGRAMDGSPFEMTLDGFCALIIGAMGAGKSLGALRTIAEALTACRDAVVWDLDPIKGGLAEFGGLMDRRARTPEECEAALEDGLAYVSGRRHLMDKLGMGDRWHASAEHPNLYINIDEFIQLSPRGKDLAIKILRTGRQYGIYLIMAGQEATADALGDAIAMIIAYRILMACRFEDVRIAFGPGAGALGYRPDRMKPAVGPIANDAGQAMIMGGGFVRAIRYQFHQYSRDQIVQAVKDRVAAGVPQVDSDTLLATGGKHAHGMLADQLAQHADGSDSSDAAALSVIMREFEDGDVYFLPTASLLETLRLSGHEGLDSEGLGKLLRRHAPGVSASRDNSAPGKPRGWTRGAIEEAAEGLLNPVRARSQAG